MAKYIEGYCDPQMPPPYRFQDVRIQSFPVLADRTKVQDVVDRFLGPSTDSLEVLQGAEGTPAAASTVVYVMVLDYGRMSCIDPPQSLWGYVTQREIYPGILMVSLDPPNLVLFAPYIFVDNPWSVICGNMVLGYPKQLASFQMGSGAGDPYPIEVDTLVFPQFSPNTPLQPRPIARIAKAANAPPPPDGKPSSPFGDLDLLFGPGGMLPVDPSVLGVLDSNALSYQVMQLKQVRSGQDPDQACYRSIVSGTVTIESIAGGALLPSATIQLGAYASSDIGQALGLSFASPLPFELTCNFTLGNVQEQIWD